MYVEENIIQRPTWAKHVIPCIAHKAMHLCVNLHFQAVPSYKAAARFRALISSERTAYKTSLTQLGPVNFNGTPGVIQYLRRHGLLHREWTALGTCI